MSETGVPKRRIAVTGASGFLGLRVCAELAARGHDVRALVRAETDRLNVPQVRYRGLDDAAGLAAGLAGVTVVVHLAARVHIMRDHSHDPLREFRRVNVQGTRTLAEFAAREGAKEFFFASSVKAMGEHCERPWKETDPPAPVDPYGVSKLEGEAALAEISAGSGMSTVALRLPLAYGSGVRANILRLFALVDRGWPLPLGGIDNRRSLIFAGNVGAAIALLIDRVQGHEVFFASDGHDVSTSELLEAIGHALGRQPRLLPAPRRAAELLRRMSPRRAGPPIARLFGSLTVDDSKLRSRIGGRLPYSFEEGIGETARWFRSRERRERRP